MTGAHAALDPFGVAWRLGLTLFFVALNGFFVAAEFALVKVRESRIDQLVRDGSRSAPTVKHILGNLDRYLSACQLGITLASLILGALGEPAVSVLLLAGASWFGLSVAADHAWLPVVSIAVAFAVITTLHMTVGEQAPKMWALRRPERVSLTTGPILRVFAWMFGPFIVIINWTSNRLLRVAGLPADQGHDTSHSAEEIRSILSLSASAGTISEQQYQIIENLFQLIKLEVRHIVVPRVEVDFLSLERGVEQNLKSIRTSGHSRFALCNDGLDNIVGIVHAKDVLDAALRGEVPDLKGIARAAVFVPDTMPLSGFMAELQSSQQHCAVVLDEHGTAIGLAFREDALERIVGPLGDEFDAEEKGFVELADGTYEAPGQMSLPEVAAWFEIELGDDEREGEDTIGGHVTARLGRLPRKGDSVQVGAYQATVLEVSRRRVHRLRLTPLPPAEEVGEQE